MDINLPESYFYCLGQTEKCVTTTHDVRESRRMIGREIDRPWAIWISKVFGCNHLRQSLTTVPAQACAAMTKLSWCGTAVITSSLASLTSSVAACSSAHWYYGRHIGQSNCTTAYILDVAHFWNDDFKLVLALSNWLRSEVRLILESRWCVPLVL